MAQTLEQMLAAWMLAGNSPDEFALPDGVRQPQFKALLERWGRRDWIEYAFCPYWSWPTIEGEGYLQELINAGATTD